MFTIQVARKDDAGDIAKVHAACFEQGWNADYFIDVIDNPHYICIKAVQENEIVGLCLCSYICEEIEIYSICVLPQHRGLGIAKRMLDYIFAYDNTSVSLEVSVENIAALRLYKSAGFVEQSIRKGYYTEKGRCIDALLMIKYGSANT